MQVMKVRKAGVPWLRTLFITYITSITAITIE